MFCLIVFPFYSAAYFGLLVFVPIQRLFLFISPSDEDFTVGELGDGTLGAQGAKRGKLVGGNAVVDLSSRAPAL